LKSRIRAIIGPRLEPAEALRAAQDSLRALKEAVRPAATQAPPNVLKIVRGGRVRSPKTR